MKRLAVIDLGTNTFNLLIFEKDEAAYKVLHSEKSAVGLGLGGINANTITPVAANRALQALGVFKEKCDQFGVSEIFAFGTSALRGATNTMDLVREVYQKWGIVIQVISGEEEADLIFEGVRSVYAIDRPTCIMDIGGGSTEFIIVNANKEIVKKRSFNIGIARVIQMFDLEDPLSEVNKQWILDFFQNIVGDFFDDINHFDLVGASGSFETFYELMFSRSFNSSSQAIELPVDLLQKELITLINSTFAYRKQSAFVQSIREQMVHIAALKTWWVMQKIKPEKVILSPASLKEGVMVRLLNK
ncbi:MAG: hypothetical protein JJT77_02880 [Crocinitomicaceae bacterium]|nr:hypothetical protein [Crocinitomicaceae bacterium]